MSERIFEGAVQKSGAMLLGIAIAQLAMTGVSRDRILSMVNDCIERSETLIAVTGAAESAASS